MDEGEGAAKALICLAERYDLADDQRRKLATLLELLARQALAPTTVRSPEQAVDVHVADSLVALELEAVRSARAIADLGSGAGFPGLVLAVALPESELWLVESQARKSAFIERIRAAVGVDNAHVVCARAEEWPAGVDRHDVVTARAIAAQPVVLEYAAPLLRLGGTFVDWRGVRVPAEEDAAASAAEELGLRRAEIRRVAPFAAARDHHLHVFTKVAETPARFPRRAGMARKRPLGRR
jgi:16S rRNA (guanine527-N7)-methyltransferase